MPLLKKQTTELMPAKKSHLKDFGGPCLEELSIALPIFIANSSPVMPNHFEFLRAEIQKYTHVSGTESSLSKEPLVKWGPWATAHFVYALNRP